MSENVDPLAHLSPEDRERVIREILEEDGGRILGYILPGQHPQSHYHSQYQLHPELFLHKEESMADETIGPENYGPNVTTVVSGGEVWVNEVSLEGTTDSEDEGGDDSG